MAAMVTRDMLGKTVEFAPITRMRKEDGCKYGVVMGANYNPDLDAPTCWVRATRTGDIWLVRVDRLTIVTGRTTS